MSGIIFVPYTDRQFCHSQAENWAYHQRNTLRVKHTIYGTTIFFMKSYSYMNFLNSPCSKQVIRRWSGNA